MDDFVHIEHDAPHVKKERAKARELRNSNWWKQKLDLGLCYYCGKKFCAEELSMDHIVPISRKGRSTKGNCVTCCKECNNKKSCLTPAEIILNKLSIK